jgi:NCAIR mutase (PurE)-related protein
MKPEELRLLLTGVSGGRVSVNDALKRLVTLPFEDLGFANVDHHRALRTGFPEIVLGSHKTADEIAPILDAIHAQGQIAVATRIDPEKAKGVLAQLSAATVLVARYEPLPRLLIAGEPTPPNGRGTIAVVSAGTADRWVAEEAARTAELLGNAVIRIQDVGVAGLHRLLAHRNTLEEAEVVIVIAGMEGALPSVIGGLISRPVIAVPTSVGLGAHFDGLTALFSMLNSCASGITVVNVDNGFGVGYAASLINAKRAAP